MNSLVRQLSGQQWGQVMIAYLQRLGVSRQLLILLGSQLLTAGAGLAYGKLITLFIDPTVFGDYTVQTTTLLLVISVSITPTIQSFIAASQQRGVLAIMPFYSRLTGLFLGGSLLLVSYLWLASLVGSWIFFAWGVGTAQCILSYSTGLLMAMGRIKTYAWLQSLNPLLNLLLLSLLIFGFDQLSPTGLWCNALLLNASLGLLAMLSAHRADPAFRPTFTRVDNQSLKTTWASYTAFVVPLLGYALCSSINNYADRYFIDYLISPASVGFYAVAYSIGSRLGVIGNPFVNHLGALMYGMRKEGRHEETTPAVFKHLKLLWLAGLPVCAVLYIFQKQIGLLLLSARYETAFALIPVLGLAAVVLYSIQLFETKFYAYEQTRFILFHALIGALANAALNWLLIPAFGLIGASLSTLISFSIQLIVVFLLNKSVKFHDN